jgi:hypothetical protein
MLPYQKQASKRVGEVKKTKENEKKQKREEEKKGLYLCHFA